jgi:hypothetical protein
MASLISLFTINVKMSKQLRISKGKELYRYLWLLGGVWFLFMVTAFLACFRVSHSPKFSPYNSYLKDTPPKSQLH